MKTTHVLWTTVEEQFLKKHYPTSMSMGQICNALPRHTPNAIKAHAQKQMRLKRPSRRGELRQKPAWDRMKLILESEHLTVAELVEQCGVTQQPVSELLALHRKEIYVAAWRPPVGKGHWKAVWAVGDEPDAPTPFIRRTAAAKAARKTDPFQVAAGLVAVPKGTVGRIYAQSMESADELEAA